MPIADPGLEENFLYNKDFAKGNKYTTDLSPDEEEQYRQWFSKINDAVGGYLQQDDPSYDMRGFFQKNRDMEFGKGQHFPDTFKTPYHPTFSRESKYAKSTAPYWNDREELIDPRTKLPTPGFFKEVFLK